MGEARRTLSIAVGVAAAILAMGTLAACGGGGDSNEVTVEIDEQVGFDGDSVLERQARAENLIRDCMKVQGFEYTPVDPVAQEAALTGSRGLSEAEFEEQFGYGITTLFEERLAQAVSGPNDQYYATLTASEQAAYDRALYGDDKTATFAVALDTGDFSKLGGCLKEATNEVFGGPELVADITAALDDLDERILADQRVFDVVEKWSDCMRRAGYDLAEQDEVDVFLENSLEGIVGPLEEAQPTPPGEEPAYDVDALRDLQREELAIVKSDIACEEKHVEETEVKVRAEYERDFREKNAALLERVPPA